MKDEFEIREFEERELGKARLVGMNTRGPFETSWNWVWRSCRRRKNMGRDRKWR